MDSLSCFCHSLGLGGSIPVTGATLPQADLSWQVMALVNSGNMFCSRCVRSWSHLQHPSQNTTPTLRNLTVKILSSCKLFCKHRSYFLPAAASLPVESFHLSSVAMGVSQGRAWGGESAQLGLQEVVRETGGQATQACAVLDTGCPRAMKTRNECQATLQALVVGP